MVREILVEVWLSLELGSWYSQGCFSLRLTRKLCPCNVQIAKQDLIFGCAHTDRLPLAATESAITPLFASDLDFYSGLFQIILNIIQDFLNEYKQYFCNITSSFSTGKCTGKSSRPLFLLNIDLWNLPTAKMPIKNKQINKNRKLQLDDHNQLHRIFMSAIFKMQGSTLSWSSLVGIPKVVREKPVFIYVFIYF